MSSIKIVSHIPGPNSVALKQRRSNSLSNGLADLTSLAITSAEGAVVTDADGNHLLDFAGGIGALAAGHCPPSVSGALARQAENLLHMCSIVASYDPMIELAEMLNSITPGDFAKKSLFMNSGAEAVEAAVKLARVATGNSGVLVFEGGYHGRTNMTMSMTSKYGLFKKGFGPFAPEVYRIPFPNVFRRPRQMSETQFIDWSIERLNDALISQVDPSGLAAIVIEPVQGEGGFIPAPPSYMQAIRDLCDQHGIVMIADEIQCGFGRTGKLFAIEYSGVAPDLITTGKSLASGLPIAAVTGKAQILDAAHPGGMGGTYSGNPLACVAALETIKLINQPEFLANALMLGDKMRSALEKLAAEHNQIIDVRGLGPMLAFELGEPTELTPNPELTSAITTAALKRGLIVIRAGLYSNCVRLLPPLTLTEAQLDEGLDVLSEAVAEVMEEQTLS